MKCRVIISTILLCSAVYTDNIYVIDDNSRYQNLWSLFLPAVGTVPPPPIAIIAQFAPNFGVDAYAVGITISLDGATLYVFLSNGMIYSIPSDGSTAATLWATINSWDENKIADGIAASTTPGSVYVLVYDYMLNQDAIILVSPSGQQTIANPTKELAGIVIASSLYGYATDPQNSQVVQIALTTGTITPLVINSPPSDFSELFGIAITPDRTTLVVNTYNNIYTIPIADPNSYNTITGTPVESSATPGFNSVAVVPSGRDVLAIDYEGQILKFSFDIQNQLGNLVSDLSCGGGFITTGPTP